MPQALKNTAADSPQSYICVTDGGCYISSGGADFLIDPGESGILTARCKCKRPHAVLISSSRAECSAGFSQLYTPGGQTLFYSSAVTKSLMYRQYVRYGKIFRRRGTRPSEVAVEEIIGWDFNKKIVINRGKHNQAELAFYKSGSFPGMSAIFIKTNQNSILYTCGGLPPRDKLPEAEIYIMRPGRKAFSFPELPTGGVINTVSLSDIYDVLSYFNRRDDRTVGIDKSALEPACYFLRLGVPVFSGKIRPLSDFKNEPEFIITSDCKSYQDRIKIPPELFTQAPDLAGIYAFCRGGRAKKAFVISSDFRCRHERRRGNITFSGGGTYDLSEYVPRL